MYGVFTSSTMILKNKRIFIIEDDVRNRIVFQMALVREGAVVDFERWDDHMLSRMRSTTNPIDLIVLDLMLPGNRSGFDLYDQIRTIEHLNGVPVVAVSAMDPSLAMPIAISKGLDGFIAKPIDTYHFPRQLLQVIEGKPFWLEQNEG
ncbi:MAG: response regulator [Anaerolineae bacterium]|nr:response regulator [Anaerolineae bacterium]